MKLIISFFNFLYLQKTNDNNKKELSYFLCYLYHHRQYKFKLILQVIYIKRLCFVVKLIFIYYLFIIIIFGIGEELIVPKQAKSKNYDLSG